MFASRGMKRSVTAANLGGTFRLRTQLKSVQMDPWFIEKKRRHTRIRVQDIVIRD